jgi:hypothetical protein
MSSQWIKENSKNIRDIFFVAAFLGSLGFATRQILDSVKNNEVEDEWTDRDLQMQQRQQIQQMQQMQQMESEQFKYFDRSRRPAPDSTFARPHKYQSDFQDYIPVPGPLLKDE